VLLFVGVGVFNAVATWLDTLLIGYGHKGAAGPIISIMTVAGIAGAALLPGVAARRQRRRELMMIITATSSVVFLAVAVVHGLVFVGSALALLGFAMLAGLPVALDWSELEAGPRRAGTATGFLLLAGNLGGAVLVLVVQLLIDNSDLALGALALVGVPGVLIASRLPRHVRRHGDAARAGASPGPAPAVGA
jgi:sugar phosphate permease